MVEKVNVKLPKTVKLKTYVATTLVLAVLLLASVGYVLTSNGTTVTITPQSYTETASYVIFKVGSTYYAKNGSTGEIEFSGTNATQVIRNALNSLTSGRTWKEIVLLKGEFLIDGYITIKNYTKIVIDGVLKAKSSWNPSRSGFPSSCVGILEIGQTLGEIVTDVEICGGKIEGNFYSSYPTESGNNEHVTGIQSWATLQNVWIHHIVFDNLITGVMLEGLGGNSQAPSKFITIENLVITRVKCGIQTYANGYTYSNLVINNIQGENSYDDFVAVVGHYNGATHVGEPNVTNVIIQNINVWNKNGNAGAVVKLDGGDSESGKGRIYNIIVKNIIAYTDTTGIDSGIELFKGQYTERVEITNVEFRGNFYYGIWLQTNGKQILISNFIIEAYYNIFLQFNKEPTYGNNQFVQITNGYCGNNGTSAGNQGMGIALSAGNADQGIRNLHVENVRFWYKTYCIYEGDSPPTGVQGNYTTVYYDIDIGERPISSLCFNSTDRHVKIWKYGKLVSENSGTATISASTSVTFEHELIGTPDVVLVGWQDTGYGTWSWSANSTHITITVTNSGTYDFSWYAEYKP